MLAIVGLWVYTGYMLTNTLFMTKVTKSEVYFNQNGAYCWKSNNRPVPVDCVTASGVDQLPNFDLAKQKQACEESAAEAIKAYREFRASHGYSNEELFEMRAAFGQGKVVVDVFTREKIKL